MPKRLLDSFALEKNVYNIHIFFRRQILKVTYTSVNIEKAFTQTKKVRATEVEVSVYFVAYYFTSS